jgi:hypothetical protein
VKDRVCILWQRKGRGLKNALKERERKLSEWVCVLYARESESEGEREGESERERERGRERE